MINEIKISPEEQALKNIESLLPTLSKREREYWNMIRPNSGVLNLIGKPGLFKTAILRCISKKLHLLHIDHRLTVMDETDLGCYPKTKQRGTYEVIYYPIPEWAFDAAEALEHGYNGAFMIFEELNRASSFMRNASLKILLEKEIGVNFKFPLHVYMAATGNLGIDDKTDVEEFDTALLSRLITFEHNPGLDEWVESFAKENIHKDILYFLKHNPAFYYPSFVSNVSKTITNPRTWTFLSDYIVKNFGKDSTHDDYCLALEVYGSSYINSADLIEFMKFMKSYYKISYKDVLLNKENVLTKENLEKFDRDTAMRLINDLKTINILNLRAREVDNLITFLNLVEPDSRLTFLYETCCDYTNYTNEDFDESANNNLNKILNFFSKEKKIIQEKAQITAKQYQE